ncbi:hypothetical protein ACFY97_18635 [Streptomyces klenkii]|uniref:hypothetical protein n=1 Tax=Streptomyces klenkii TaxID=1420899 RepID=UPI0036E71F28
MDEADENVDEAGPVTLGDPREVLVEIQGPALGVSQVRAWITARSGSLTGEGQVVSDIADDPKAPGWSRCRMTVVPADG